ncbi:cytochrome bd quinol oxidase subunit 2 apoprotein [Halogeometricum borinquense DSM 11551]|uniref:Cytochrome bd quinol oxidase subunit 2 apoprotein n=2 Tax=Halogeometricum borinquense TaxID=60847 RepID=L9UKG5_HALBP|nr:cytochrome bd quinol oxidase subunit 2 apoprotein [Halogeometricum borinquense DSM 11551]
MTALLSAASGTVTLQTYGLADGPLFGLPLPEMWFALVFFILGTFLFLDGFDFGVGAIFATREDEDEREQLLSAIGPFWDGNEVWLVVFGGALFAAFPAVYANLFSRNYLLMFAILGALIMRGLAPEMYEQRHDESWQRWWGRAFVAGSVLAPFFLGVFAANWFLGATTLVSLASIVVGVAVVALTVVSGAAFLGLKTRGSLRDETVRYGPPALVAYLGLVVVAVGYLLLTRPAMRADLLAAPSLGLVGLSVVLGVAYVVTMRREQYVPALAAAAGLTYGLVTLVATLLYPFADPGSGLTVSTAIVSTLPLNLMSIASALLLPLVFSYFVVLYSTFRGPVESGESYAGE